MNNTFFFISLLQMNHLIIFAAVLHTVVDLMGYDCGSKILNITTLSLLDVGPCDIP